MVVLSYFGDLVSMRELCPGIWSIGLGIQRIWSGGIFFLYSPVQSVGNLSDRCLRVLAERLRALEAERQRELAERETARQVEMARDRNRDILLKTLQMATWLGLRLLGSDDRLGLRLFGSDDRLGLRLLVSDDDDDDYDE